MKRLGVSLVVLATALVPVAAASARGHDLKPERVRLTAADNALAKRGVVVPAWLPAGWKRSAPSPSSDETIVCKEYEADLSRFTITGNAKSAFEHPSGVKVDSEVEVFASQAQATADLRVQTDIRFARCFRALLLGQFSKSLGPGASVTVTAARATAPPAGERSGAFRLVVTASRGGVTVVKVYIDLVMFQKGRSLGYLSFLSVDKPVSGLAAPLARGMASRL